MEPTLPFENSVPDVELGYGYFNGRVQALPLFQLPTARFDTRRFSLNRPDGA
jgi:hypothetical protein